MSTLLLIAIFLPSAAAVIIGRDLSRARQAAIFTAMLTLATAALPAYHIVANTVSPSGLDADPTVELIAIDLPWYVSTDGSLLRPALRARLPNETVLGRSLAMQGTKSVRFELGLDGRSVWPFLLTCLTVLAAAAIGPNCPVIKSDLGVSGATAGLSSSVFRGFLSCTAGQASSGTREGGGAAYYRLLLVLQTGLLGLFAAREALLFFVFYEFSLIPFFFMIAAGNPDSRRAAARFLCIEAGGGQMVLLGLLAGMATGDAATGSMATGVAAYPWIFFVLAAGFAVRAVAAPFFCLSATSWSISSAATFFLPAGLLAMSGIYGALLFARPMLPESASAGRPWLLSLAVAAIVCAVPAAAEKGADS